MNILVNSEFNNKDDVKSLTVVKIGGPDYWPTPQDLEDIKNYCNAKISLENLPSHFSEIDISVEKIRTYEHQLMIIRVGDDEHNPTEKELEAWRQVFEKAHNENDLKIFTHSHVQIDVIPLKGRRLELH